MNVIETEIPDVWILEPQVFADARGFFLESYNERTLAQVGINARFVQDNHSRSSRNVLRGLHYQVVRPQGKLVRVVSGKAFDVAVDLRRHSATFGQWVGVSLSAENKRILWIPEGFAHGFWVLSDHADVLYKATDFYMPPYDRCIRWDDPTLRIRWPLDGEPILSEKDRAGCWLTEAEVFP
jgi:dTDP-4-dehydrorhamnose 3,5-epimerase